MIPVNAKVDLGGCDADRIFDQVQVNQAQREKEQRELRQRASVDLLDDDISFAEYRARRAATLITEPSIPLDEMSYRDYRAARAFGAESRFSSVDEPSLINYDGGVEIE